MQETKGKKQTANGLSVACPFCGSTETQQETDFGTTLAYAQFYCRRCRTPFEWIKWEDKNVSADLPPFILRPQNAKASIK
jgi:ring-1,2-phenylacetyl-CoA epoxidase subunit PaaD